ncbi:hypothetical protein [Rubrobacter indicoceani]|uniref:hypothetical protein n=1 Tax=Rubrobacter indicoceani TaxID=2051957 RepID=UPI000E5B7229|nr:hypothetical protein [Rubrobacter indicoceani]
MSFFLSTFGFLLLAVSLALVAFGVLMALNRKTRQSGKYFALWWVPGTAAASGIITRDSVTFTVGAICFVVAGGVFLLENRSVRAEGAQRTNDRRSRRVTERTAAETPRRGGHRRKAS